MRISSPQLISLETLFMEKSYREGQSAGNYCKYSFLFINKMNTNRTIGPSETTREASVFNLTPFYESLDITPETANNQPSSRFLEWLIGFTEGDGCFQLIKQMRPCFVINQKDPQVLYLIKKTLKFGSVTKIKATQNVGEHHRYKVYKLHHILQLIYLFQDNLILSKVRARLDMWVEGHNILCDRRNILKRSNSLSLPKVQIHPSPTPNLPNLHLLTLTSGWLSGFIDAEGTFYASLTPSKRHYLGLRLRLKFAIKQKGEKKVLEKVIILIRDACGDIYGPKVYDVTGKPDTYCCELTKLTHLHAIVKYLDTFPLLSKVKKLVFVRWTRVIKRKRPKTENQKAIKRFNRLVASVGKIRIEKIPLEDLSIT